MRCIGNARKHSKTIGEAYKRYLSTNALSLEIRGMSFFCPELVVSKETPNDAKRYPKHNG